MDRELSASARRANRARLAATIAAPALAFAAVLALLPGWMRPSMARTRLRTAVVERGPIEAVITAAGTVAPEVERVLVSPVDARLLRVLKRAGAAVRAGDAIAELDLGESALALDRALTSREVADNQRSQARLTLERSLADLDGRIERAALDLQLLTDKADSGQRLFTEGLVSQQSMREARLAARQADIALAQLRREREHAAAAAALQAEGLALERTVLDKEAAQARRQLDLGTTRSDRDGVVTWVRSEEGALVRRGEVVARIADLRSFRVDATVADVHAPRIVPGTPVMVQAGETLRLEGRIAEVQPTVEGGTVRFKVSLAEPAHAGLRPSLRMDVLVITERRPSALKVRQGVFPAVGGRPAVFVVRGGRARRVPAAFGLRGFDEVEVLAGPVEGDEVVISDMRDYAHLAEVEVR